MRRDDALRVLREQRERLGGFGVKSLALFGSVARDQAGPGSDVDVLVEFDGPPTFDQYIGLKLYLEGLLGAHVDLASPRTLRPRIRSAVEREAIHVA